MKLTFCPFNMVFLK